MSVKGCEMRCKQRFTAGGTMEKNVLLENKSWKIPEAALSWHINEDGGRDRPIAAFMLVGSFSVCNISVQLS